MAPGPIEVVNREHQKAVDAILLRALDLPETERGAFLESACTGDDHLRAEVEGMLAMASASTAQVADIVERAAWRLQVETRPLAEGTRLGAYELVRELGRGGMGAVYLARRSDREYEKFCAIKIIRHGMETGEMLARFRFERQILARLEHPNVCRLLDGGTTEDGRPFLVMEYVEGTPLLEYCDRANLSLQQRLRTFVQICDAVAYAHRSLVIHRDLKASNILVAADGTPKLLDFGIAKLVADAPDAAVTLTEQRILTPEYASPEQLRGEPLTTATDVYSLGVLLYRLLAGAHPYRADSTSAAAVIAAIYSQEPAQMSAAARGHRDAGWVRRLRGDLDTIAATALRKEPERRYESAEAFSVDVRRYLEGLPVHARGDSFRYRASKFVGRNRAGTALAAVLILTLVAFVGATARQNVRITKERNTAERVSKFLVEIFKAADPRASRTADVTARQVLDEAAGRVSREMAGEPEVRATIEDSIGAAYVSLGLYDKAERLFRSALALRKGIFGGEHVLVAVTLNNLAEARAAKGAYGEAEQMHVEALRIRRKLLGAEDPQTQQSASNLAVLYMTRGEYGKAEQMDRETLAIRRRQAKGRSVDVAYSLNNLAVLLYRKGEYGEAEKLYREALAEHQAVHSGPHPQWAMATTNLGVLLARTGRLVEAEALYREALEMRRKLYGGGHPDIALTLNNLGSLQQEKLDFAAAEQSYTEAIEMYESLVGKDSVASATPLLNRGNLYAQQGRLSDAETELRHCLAIDEKALGPHHPSRALAATWLSYTLMDEGKTEEAAKLLEQSLAVQRKMLNKGSVDLGMTLTAHANLLLKRGDVAQAEVSAREAVEILRKALPAGHWRIASAESSYGECLKRLGRPSEAGPLLQGAYEVLLAKRGTLCHRTLDARARLQSLSGVR
jgi:serine/threonine-protein kinase